MKGAERPFGFQPVSKETARVMKPGALLRVSGTPRNEFARVLSPEATRAAGFELVNVENLVDAHTFGVQRTTTGGRLGTGASTTATYRRLP